MKISLLVSSLSTNVLVRAFPIAEVLERFCEIEVIGPVVGNGVYAPYRNGRTYIEHRVEYGGARKTRNLLSAIVKPLQSASGDVVYAFKVKATSFGSGLLAQALKRKPLVLDIDDWDAEPYHSAKWTSRIGRLARFYDPEYCWWYNRGLESLVRWADQRTVVSSFLQKRYGGTILPQLVDTRLFDPGAYDRAKLRHSWGVGDKRVLLFTGNAIGHKGLDTLLKAVRRLLRNDVVIMVVGLETQFLCALKREAGTLLRHILPQPHEKMPEFLSLCDAVVLPQKNVPFACAQIPAKIVEAMAMAKPIITTDVSDLGDMIRNCGWVVPPDDEVSLSAAIAAALENGEDARARARRARDKCIANYSYDAAEIILSSVFMKYR